MEAAALEDDPIQPVRSFEELRWLLTRGALDGRDLRLVVSRPGSGSRSELLLPLGRIDAREADARLLRKVGIVAPWSPPVLGDVLAGGAAERAGLRPGDLVLRIDRQAVGDAQQLRDLIRRQVHGGRGIAATWEVSRNGRVLQVPVTPDVVQDGEHPAFGRIAALVGAPPPMVTVRYGPVEGLWKGMEKTWEVSALTLRMMGRMVIGQASVKNLSGPLTIADYAGQSASLDSPSTCCSSP